MKTDVFSLFQSQNHAAIFSLIEHKTIQVDSLDKNKRSLLIHGTLENNIDFIKKLLEYNPSLNLLDKLGKSAMHYAARNKYFEIAAMLLQSGADIDLRDSYGNTPLNEAVFTSKGDGSMIKFLLQRGADRNLENYYGVSPLKLAQTIVNYNIIEFFE